MKMSMVRVLGGLAVAGAMLVSTVTVAEAATVGITAYRPPATPRGAAVTVKARATGSSVCRIAIAGVVSYGHPKAVPASGNVSWRPLVPMTAGYGPHKVTIHCSKRGYAPRTVVTYLWVQVEHTILKASSSTSGVQYKGPTIHIPARDFKVTWTAKWGENGEGLLILWQDSHSTRFDYLTGVSPQTSGVGTFHHGASDGWFEIESGADNWSVTVTGIW